MGAHHGLFDCINMDEKSGFKHRIEADREELCYDEALESFFENVISEDELDDLFHKAVDEVREKADVLKDAFYRSMLVRLLTSILVDADRHATRLFMNRLEETSQELPSDFWERNLKFCQDKIEKLPIENGVDEVRRFISDCCYKRAKGESGVYILNAKTGGGKTLTALRCALTHIVHTNSNIVIPETSEGKDKLFYITSLLSVLEQNSEVIHEYIMDKTAILEHHSNVLHLKETKESLNDYELAVNSLGSPIIISTLFQFLNNLFGGKMSYVRRMQALCNSVIIIDEVQSLPWKLTAMFNQAMNFLCDMCNATVILCSATQPSFHELLPSMKLAKNAELLPYSNEIFQVLKRTNIIDKTRPEGYSTLEAANFAISLLKNVSSALFICNTKKTARVIFWYARDCGYEVYHLSKSMCMNHRSRILKRIKEILKYNSKNEKKRKLLCVSTQVFEAGIDASFETVVRANAGLDNIIQSAGRCNRSFEFGYICNVYIINI